MPLCQFSDVLHSWGDFDKIVRAQFKVPVLQMLLSLTAYVSIVDKLETEGCIEMVLCSSESDAAQVANSSLSDFEGMADLLSPQHSLFLGARVPNVVAPRMSYHVKAKVETCRVRFSPLEPGNCRVQFVVISEEKCRIEKLGNQTWKFLSRSAVGTLVARNQEEQARTVSSHKLEFYKMLEHKVNLVHERWKAASQPRAGLPVRHQGEAESASGLQASTAARENHGRSEEAEPVSGSRQSANAGGCQIGSLELTDADDSRFVGNQGI